MKKSAAEAHRILVVVYDAHQLYLNNRVGSGLAALEVVDK